MIYKINGVNVSDYGAVAILSGEQISVSGIFDCVKRKAPTERSWGTQIEPFVDEEDIAFDGREISISFLVKNKADLETFKTAIIQTTVLEVDSLNFNVLCRSDVVVSDVGECQVLKASFYEENVSMPEIEIQATDTGKIRIDGYNLHDQFGIHGNAVGGFYSVGKTIEINTTETYTNTQYRELRELSINCFIVGSSFSDMYTKMSLFHSLLYKPGMRVLYVDGLTCNCYHKAGFKAQVVANNLIKFTLKLTVHD